MDLEKTLAKINQNRGDVEASFVFCLWKDPSLYEDYKDVNKGNDTTLRTGDAKFYFALGRGMWEQGLRVFDNISLYTYLQNKPTVRKQFDVNGGWKECAQLMSLVDTSNTDSYFDRIAKMNTLGTICEKYDELFNTVERFDKATNEEVYGTFELLNTQVSLRTGHSSKIESLIVDEDYLQKRNSGAAIGLKYDKAAPILNYSTLGIPVGDIYLVAGHSGTGKTSFIFENMVLPLSESGVPVCIISNEMKVDAYKDLLMMHILTKELGYWKMTRKRFKQGGFDEEQFAILRKAAAITSEKYSNIKFVKLFDNDASEVIKYIKNLSRQGVKCFVWDTMKSDDNVSEEVWLQLLLNSRKIFNAVSKANVALIATFQLSLHTLNQRYLDSTCLASSKQIKEVVSEIVMMRELWEDEYTGQRNDCHPYRRRKDPTNPDSEWKKEPIALDKDKKYRVCFLDKTRNDERGQCILYEFNGVWNTWREIGYCTIMNDHNSYG